MEWRLWTNEAIGGQKPQAAWEQPVCQDAVLRAGADKQSRRLGWGSFRGTAAPVTAMFRVPIKPGRAHLQQLHKMHTRAGPPSFLLRPQSPAWQAERALTADSLPAQKTRRSPARALRPCRPRTQGPAASLTLLQRGREGRVVASRGLRLHLVAWPWGAVPRLSGACCLLPALSALPLLPPPSLVLLLLAFPPYSVHTDTKRKAEVPPGAAVGLKGGSHVLG